MTKQENSVFANKQFPKTWSIKSLGDFMEFRNGVNFLSTERGYHYTIIGVAGFQNYFSPKKDSFETIEVEKPLPNADLLQKGDLLFVRSNGNKALIGRCLFMDGLPSQTTFSGFTIRGRVHSDLLMPKYVALFFRTSLAIKQLYLLGGGTNISNISQTILSNFEIPVPPLPEQKKIAEILSTWDAAIEQVRKLIEAKKKFKSGIMQQLLTGKLRFKENKDKWHRVKIGDVLEEISRPIKFDDEALYELISIRRRSSGIFCREKRHGSEILTKDLYKVESGDFLISKMQVVHGALGLVSPEFDGKIVSGSYICLRAKNNNRLNIEFFNHLTCLRAMYRKAFVSSYGVHIEKMTFNLDLYLKEWISIPPSIQEQKKIVSTINVIADEITLLNKKLSLYNIQKKALMQKLLTGQIRVNVDK